MIEKEELTREIVRDEFVQSLAEMPEDVLTALFGAPFARMKDFAQNNPHHCYDLLRHTVQTALSVDRCISETEFLCLRIAALFHDIGKPEVAFEKNGRTVFYGHAEKSAEIARALLREIGFSDIETERLCFFIAHHDDFISFKYPEEITDPNNPFTKEINRENVAAQVGKVQREAAKQNKFIPTYADYILLTNLCTADASAQSETAVMNGRVADTKKRKIERMTAVRNCLLDRAELS